MVWGCEFPLGAGVLLCRTEARRATDPLVTHSAENGASIPCSSCTRSDRVGEDREQE